MAKGIYRHWTRAMFFSQLKLQAQEYHYQEYEIAIIKAMVYHKGWDPVVDYDGCTGPQDPQHPYLPCFKHDFNWRVRGGGKWADVEFLRDLERCGMHWAKRYTWYYIVRIYWLLWARRKKRRYATNT